MPIREQAWPEGTPCWVDVQVDDLVAARSFYTGLFGWEIADGPGDAGGYLMALRGGKPAAGIGPKPDGMPVPSAWTTYLAADSADEIHGKVLAAGGQPFMDPFDVLDVGRMFVAADPTGAVFGVWQARTHKGMGVYNEPGACTWNELQTRDYTSGREFYAQVFGYTYTEVGDGQSMNYATISLPGAAEGDNVGGVNDLTKMPGPTPSHWLTWFNVANCDASVAKAQELGATVMMPTSDSLVGRMAILSGVQGEVFGVIDPSTTVEQNVPGQG
jgi:predicted enzyme related to lactoylglutathione lyase